jgi:hypothetical protein
MLLSKMARLLIPNAVTVLATALVLESSATSLALAAPAEAKLVPGDTMLSDALGSAVAVSGDTALLGAPSDGDLGNRSGSAYVFDRDGRTGEWLQATKINASNASAEDLFGTAVAIDGDTAVVGAPRDSAIAQRAGSAYVFARQPGGEWIEVRRLNAADGAIGDAFGTSVSIHGDAIIVGAPRGNRSGVDTGAAYVFERNHGAPGLWGQVGKLTSSDAEANDLFGWSAAVHGDRAVVGAPAENGSGRAYVFARSVTGVWSQVKRLTIPGLQPLDDFGWSVTIGDDVAIIGARRATREGVRSGLAYEFERDRGGIDNWRLSGGFVAVDAAAGDLFGTSVAIAGDVLAIGAPAKGDAAARAGSVYLFQRSGPGGGWSQIRKLTASDARTDDSLGTSVAVTPRAALVGAPGSSTGASGAGGAYLYPTTNRTVCSPTPVTDCLTSWRAGLVRVNQKVTGQERIVVRLRGDPVLAQADFGNPVSVGGGTAYRLCLYNQSGALAHQVIFDVAGSACGDVPCWRSLGGLPPGGTGFEYRAGNQQLRLHAGAGRSELLYEAKGTFPERLASRLFELPTVQLVSDDAPACFSLTMSRGQFSQRFFKGKK